MFLVGNSFTSCYKEIISFNLFLFYNTFMKKHLIYILYIALLGGCAHVITQELREQATRISHQISSSETPMHTKAKW
jgi:hypothetical protein